MDEKRLEPGCLLFHMQGELDEQGLPRGPRRGSLVPLGAPSFSDRQVPLKGPSQPPDTREKPDTTRPGQWRGWR